MMCISFEIMQNIAANQTKQGEAVNQAIDRTATLSTTSSNVAEKPIHHIVKINEYNKNSRFRI